LPAAHWLQSVAPPDEYLPGAQLSQPVPSEELSAYLPLGHDTQLPIPAKLAYLPTAHVEHVARDVSTDEYLPASQGVQEDAPGPLVLPPTQSVQVDDDAAAYLPAAHVSHTVEPGLGSEPANFPAAHSSHADAPLVEIFPFGHEVHVGEEKPLNLPAGQYWQSSHLPLHSRPVAEKTENWPAAQG